MNTLQAFRTVIPGAGCREMFQLPLPPKYCSLPNNQCSLGGASCVKRIVFEMKFFLSGAFSL